MEIFRIENLTFTYPERSVPALKNICLSVERGEFVTFCGPSGCGKTTLLRQLKPILAPRGARAGRIFFNGKPLEELSRREQSESVGFVFQNPDNQIVTDKVWHELAFGLESLGLPSRAVRLRAAEIASFFGIENWFYKNVSELSGGQKQLLNLASIMVMQPSALILDEPTSRLDPVAAADFLASVGKINRELGATILITEHRLEETLPLSDKLICMDGGEIIVSGAPPEAGAVLREKARGMFLAMPTPMRVYAAAPNTRGASCPTTIREGRDWLSKAEILYPPSETPAPLDAPGSGKIALELEEVWFRYEKEAPDVLKGFSLKVNMGDFLCVMGGNGAGKTTVLSLFCGVNKPYRGKVRIFGKELKDLTEAERSVLGAAPQNPQTLFVKKTVYDDLMEILSGRGLGKEERARRAMAAAKLCRIETALDSHPYDLSGGEQQRAALAKVLVLRPKILLLDEPTKGLDAEFKRVFAGILNNLNRRGVTVVTVSHDVEFCAEYAKRCAFVFDGATLCVGEPREFFVGNSFYTTAACRMARGILPGATTTADIIAALGGAADERIAAEGPEDFWEDAEPPALPAKQEERAALPIWRKAAAVLIALLFAATVAYIFRNSEKFAAFISGGEGAAAISGPGALEGSVALIALCAEILSFSALLFFDGEKAKAFQYQTPEDKRKFSRRTRAAAPFILLAAPLTIYLGTYYFGDRKYYFISSLLILETMAPFVATFEGRKPQARELVVISALCAIGVAGRAAFFMLPHFKPVAALAILAGVAFGGETGFLVGAVTAFASNMFFGQGPWTMWQMFAYGAVGFLAGALFSKGLLRRARAALCAYGGLATFIIYGGVMNTAAVLMFQDKPTFAMFISAIVQGIPLDLTHAAATVMFLWALARPMLEKLDRIKMKYGLME